MKISLKIVYLNNFLIDPNEGRTSFDANRNVCQHNSIGIDFLVNDAEKAKEKISEVIRNVAASRQGEAKDDLGLSRSDVYGFGAFFTTHSGENVVLENAEWIQTKVNRIPYVSFTGKMDIRRIIDALIKYDMTPEAYYAMESIFIKHEGKVVTYKVNTTGITDSKNSEYFVPFSVHDSVISEKCGRFLFPIKYTSGTSSVDLEWFKTELIRGRDGAECSVDIFCGVVSDKSSGIHKDGLFYFVDDNSAFGKCRVIPWRAIEYKANKAEGRIREDVIAVIYSDLAKYCSGTRNVEVVREAYTENKLRDCIAAFSDASIMENCMWEEDAHVKYESICEVIESVQQPNYNIPELENMEYSVLAGNAVALKVSDNSELIISLGNDVNDGDVTDFPQKILTKKYIYRLSSEKYGTAELNLTNRHITIENDQTTQEYSVGMLEHFGMNTDKMRHELEVVENALPDGVSPINFIDDARKVLPPCMKKICDEITRFLKNVPNGKRNELLRETFVIVDPMWSEISDILYPNGRVPDKNIVTEVYYRYKQFINEGKVSQFAIVGDPGSGKTTLAEGLADVFINGVGPRRRKSLVRQPIYMVTPDKIEIGYQGEAAYPIANVMKKIFVNGQQQQVLMVDEAYGLLRENNNDAGSEAVAVLLKIMNGEIHELSEDYHNNKIEVSFPNTPFIWFGGYEQEMREMVARNEGLYRRLDFLVIDTPTISQLFEYFCNEIEVQLPNLYKGIDEVSQLVKDYFRWGTSKDNVRFFANYAGVVSLVNEIVLRVNGNDSLLTIKNKLRIIIKNTKREIRKQYRASVAVKNKRASTEEGQTFETQKDIEDDFSAVKGNVNALEAMNEIKDMLINADDYIDLGINVPKGALMMGHPGTGKTLLARALAGEIQKELSINQNSELKVGFIAVASTDFKAPKDISALFSEADNYDICIIFIDEIDAIGKNRNRRDAEPKLLIQLMKEMDGFDVRGGLFVLAATNDPDVLDDALKRPGRFDRMIEVTLPDEEERVDIIRFYLGKLNMSWKNSKDDIQKLSESLAHITPGYSPAMLKNVINEAAILNLKVSRLFDRYRSAVSNGGKIEQLKGQIEVQCMHRLNRDAKAKNFLDNYLQDDTADVFFVDVREIMEVLSVGHIRPDREKEFKIGENDMGTSAVAIHEVGHALVGYWNGIKTIDFITTIPRGNAAGYVRHSADVRLLTKKDYIAMIKCTLGGRAAEEVFYSKDNISTGASRDIVTATEYAKRMIGLFGMNDEIGMMNLYENRGKYITGSDEYICSPEMQFKMDEEVRKLIHQLYAEAVAEIEEHRDQVERMAKIVFENETMSSEQFFGKL